jgi:Mycobacterium membrane protein
MGSTPQNSTTHRSSSEGDPETSPKEDAGAERASLRTAFVVGGAVLAACLGLVLYGVLGTGRGADADASDKPGATASVTYEVTGTGTADISFQARDKSGKATVVKAAALPWHRTVEVPFGRNPVVSVVLGQRGGQASCSVTIRGRHVQSATATGEFGRATCSGELPGPAASQG